MEVVGLCTCLNANLKCDFDQGCGIPRQSSGRCIMRYHRSPVQGSPPQLGWEGRVQERGLHYGDWLVYDTGFKHACYYGDS